MRTCVRAHYAHIRARAMNLTYFGIFRSQSRMTIPRIYCMTFTDHAFSAHSLQRAFKIQRAFISTQFTSFHNQRQRIKAPCLAHSIFK
jgi:hypothetical protein